MRLCRIDLNTHDAAAAIDVIAGRCMIARMHPLARFYKNTWWLWLLFIAAFIVLAMKVSPIFFILIPGLIFYSIYFGMVRGAEDLDPPPPRGFEVRPTTPQDTPPSP